MIKKNSDSSERGWHDRVLAWAAVAAAVGAGAAAIATGYQAYLTRQNNIVSQRASIYSDPSKFPLLVGKNQSGGEVVSVRMALINSGNTATKDLSFYVRCAPSAEPLPEPWVLLHRGEPPEKLPQLIGPTQSVPVACFFSMEQLEQMKAKKLRGYLIGDVTYRNRIDDSILHRTQFCLEIADVNIFRGEAGRPPRVFLNYRPVGRHNCADEDCPEE